VKRFDPATEEYLLGRAVHPPLTPEQRRAFAGRRVLITGAGGSVGAELARQVADCGPSLLVLMDHAEHALFRISRELTDRGPFPAVVSVLGDVSRSSDVVGACRLHRPEYVFHAAACKHVTIAEACIVAAARTNVVGALYAARAARDVGARFVLISTDKAAEPRSVMGATKRMAELCVLRSAGPAGAIAVRFGNVLGSSGSVVEILLESAAAGRALKVTDPDSTRYFMTAAEAVSLVLKAAISGSSGDVFWLDMGRPLRLADLVERVIDVAVPDGGARPPVAVIGLRPGEKRHEELTAQGLQMERTDDPAIWRARQAPPVAAIEGVFERLRRGCLDGEAGPVLDALQEAVIDYLPSDQARAAAGRLVPAAALPLARAHWRGLGDLGQPA
jgi:FlaA1/EpsC-like NDP-sugar epimerase